MDKDTREKEPLHADATWECELEQPQWKSVWSFLKNLKIELPAVSLLGL